jgi:hypothetical protein
VVRNCILLLLGAAFLVKAASGRSQLDPAFEKIPFDRWLGERDPARLRWTVRVTRAELSFHQRLMAQVEIKLDGGDLESRRDDGQLVFFIQVTDRNGSRYQNHGSIELSKLGENVKASNLEYSQTAFFLPGNFTLAVAILDTATDEHSARRALFRVAPQDGFLSDAWRNLPPVEFIASQESPESWYLPEIHGQLQWAASVHAPATLDVILNVAPSAIVPGSRSTASGDLAVLLPTLKAISQTGSSSISELVELLDLGRQRAGFRQDAFRQDDAHEIDWPRLKASLAEASTASIDAQSLSQRHRAAQSFVSQVRGLLRTSEKPCVLVVLTALVAFESGEDLEPISPRDLPVCRVVYIRYRPPLQSVRAPGQPANGDGRGKSAGSGVGAPLILNSATDELAPTLKPLGPKQMTRALVEIKKALLTSAALPTK